MRKLFAFILTALLLAVPVLADSGPDSRSADPAVCAHHFEVSVVREATCVQKGLLAYTCSKCGLTYTAETMPDGAHDYVLTGTTATCTEDGENIYTCTVCGDSYTEPAPATGHVSGGEASCTESEICTVCGQVLSPPLGHDYVYQFDAQRAEDGSFLSYGTWKCANCGDVMAATQGNAAYYYGETADSETVSGDGDASDGGDAESDAAESSDTDLLPAGEPVYEDDSPSDAAEQGPEAEAVPVSDRTVLWVAVSAAALVLILVETVLLVRSLKKNKTTL